MADTSCPSVLKLPELNFRQTLDQLEARASSIISLSLKWKNMDSHFDSINTAIEEREREIQLKLEEIKSREARLDAEIEGIEKSKREIEAAKELVEKDCRLLQLKTKELCEIEIGLNQARKEQLEIRDELRSKEEKIEGKEKELEFKLEKFKDLELKEKLIQEWAEEVELEKNKYMDLCKEVELKQQQCGFAVLIDGKALQVYLNDHCGGDYESMRNVVSFVLGLSSDPSMLVLDGLQGFYPPHLKKGEKEFEEEVVRKSCILLLEELMKLSPKIRAPVKKQAMTMAIDWLRKLNSHVHQSVEVLGFLLLLACYGLATSFHVDKLLARFEVISHYSQAPQIFIAMGFSDKISDLIQNLIRKKKLIEAIRYIYAFEKVSEFRPVSLLSDFLRISKIATKQLRKRDKSPGQINAANKRLADIKYALRCIEECKIEFGPSLKNLEIQIECLEKEISKNTEAASEGDKIQNSLHENEKHLSQPVAGSRAVIPVTASPTSSTLVSTSVPAAAAAQPQQPSGNKRPRTDVTAGEKLKVCHGAVQASATSSALPTTSVPATPQQLSGNKRPQTDVSAVKNLKDSGGACQASATSSALASTSVPSTTTTTQPQQLSGNKRPRTDVSAEKSLEECHGADQECEQSSLDDLQTESNKASTPLDPQPKTNCLSVNPSKEELKKLLDMCEKNQLEEGEIAAALRSASDPGKLVLDVMNVPVPFKPDTEFKAHILKTSCLLMLKQFTIVSPQINPEIREEAKKFALYWKPILGKKRQKSPLDVICFLQFLASFKLASIFDAEELLDLLDFDQWRKDAPNLCVVLGLADKIPSFIENRMKKAQHLETVKYIYALDMVEKFPPVPILKDYLSISSKKSGKKPIKAQIVEINKEIKSLEDVIKCIRDYNITGLSPETLKESILQLEKEKEEKQCLIQVSKLETRQDSPASALKTSASVSSGLEKEKEEKQHPIEASESETKPISPASAPRISASSSSLEKEKEEKQCSVEASASSSSLEKEKEEKQGSIQASASSSSLEKGKEEKQHPIESKSETKPISPASAPRTSASSSSLGKEKEEKRHSNEASKLETRHISLASAPRTSASSSSLEKEKEARRHSNQASKLETRHISPASAPRTSASSSNLEKEKEDRQRPIQTSKLEARKRPPSSAPRTYGSRPSARPQQGSRNKRPRTHISPEHRPKPYTSASSEFHRRPLQHPPRSYVDRGVPSMHSPPRHYGCAVYPPRDIELNNYGATVTHAYHWDALGNFDRRMPFHY